MQRVFQIRLLLIFVSILSQPAGCIWDRDNPLDEKGVNTEPRKDRGAAYDGNWDQGVKYPGVWTEVKPVPFWMGSPTTESCRQLYETQHHVTLSNPFRIQNTEVTQGRFNAYMGYNVSYNSKCGGSCPVERVNWHEAVAFCNRVSSSNGLTECYACSGSGQSIQCMEAAAFKDDKIYSCPGFRLPTEAEWEYAYRASTTTAYYLGKNDETLCSHCATLDTAAGKMAWYCANSSSNTSPVAGKQPNALGLYDMAGNVQEWCHDWYQPDLGAASTTDPVGFGMTDRVIRGGGWDQEPQALRAAARDHAQPTFRNYSLGFRCVRTHR